MYIMGRPPVRIDLITRIDGVNFENAWPSRETSLCDGEAVNFISLRHLRQNKLASGRHKDLGDVEALPE